MLAALAREMDLRQSYLNQEWISTIYFGGGTPSLLSIPEVNFLLDRIYATQRVDPKAEITFEVNPDDLNPEYLGQLKKSGVNRLSIGIQSFLDADMKYMHRAHTATQSFSAIEESIQAGFDNFSVDLIYGIPGLTPEAWIQNIRQVLSYEIPHLSCYALTVEPRTQLHHLIEKGKAKAPDELETLAQLESLIRVATSSGYLHYEISNFAKPGFESRHNRNYWNGTPYLGIGPSAHSFQGEERQWNIAHNQKYIDAIELQLPYYEKEMLDPVKKYNEFILTRIRTSEGVPGAMLPDAFREHFLSQVKKHLDLGTVVFNGNSYILSAEGQYIADRITVDLFYA